MQASERKFFSIIARSLVSAIAMALADGGISPLKASAQSSLPSVDQILTGLLGGRETLFAGDVLIRGTEYRSTSYTGEKETSSKSDIDQRIKVDFLENRLWHERSVGVDQIASTGELELQPTKALHREISVFGRDGFYIKSLPSSLVSANLPVAPNRFWDVRTFGMCTTDDMDNYVKLSDYRDTLTIANEDGLIKAASADEGLIRVDYFFRLGPGINDQLVSGVRRIWVDPSKDFAPVEMREQFASNGTTAIKDPDWSPPHTISNTNWQKRGGVWVPVSTTIKMDYGKAGVGMMSIHYELALEWFAVNQDFDESDYSLLELDGSDPESIVLDTRIDAEHPLITKHPGVSDPRLLAQFEQDRISMQASQRKASNSTFRVFLLGNLVVIVIAFIYVRVFRGK